MSKLAILGGRPVSKDLLTGSQLTRRKDLERKYLLEAYDSGIWDDHGKPGSQAQKFCREWARFNKSKYSLLATNGTQTLQLALEALEIGYGDEVIVPGATFQATASAVTER